MVTENVRQKSKKILDRLGLVHGQNRTGKPSHHWFVTGYGFCGSGGLNIVDIDHMIRPKLLPGEKFIALEEDGVKLSGGLGIEFVLGEKYGEATKHKVAPFIHYIVDKEHIFFLKPDAPDGGKKTHIEGHPAVAVNEKDLLGMW